MCCSGWGIGLVASGKSVMQGLLQPVCGESISWQEQPESASTSSPASAAGVWGGQVVSGHAVSAALQWAWAQQA